MSGSFVERGNLFGNPTETTRSSWLRVGWFTFELHRWWLRLGVCIGRPWYVGAYLGPVVVTVGRRHFKPPRRYTAGVWLRIEDGAE